MRMIVNLVGLLLAVVGALVVTMVLERRSEEDSLAARTRDALREIEQTVRLRSTMPGTGLNLRGNPLTIDPAWFEGEPPRNEMIALVHPWLEIASREQAELWHPEIRLAVQPSLAGFWYNPYRGVLRARVPVQVSDERSAELYNQVNGTSLRSIFEPEKAGPGQSRRPGRDPNASAVVDGRSHRSVETEAPGR